MRFARTLLGVGPALLCATLTGCGRPADRPQNLLLVVVDTLRRDRVGAYPDAVLRTPALERLARDGWRFDGAQAPRAKTTPSVASLLTGRYPHGHGVRDLLVPLGPDVPTLAGSLGAAGYDTAAIIGNFVLVARHSGLDRGFDHWIEQLPDRSGVPPHDAPQRSAGSLTDGALSALGLAGPPPDGAGPQAPLVGLDRPWFLYLHYMDPHGAYTPPQEWYREPSTRDPIGPAPAGTALHRPRVAEYNLPERARLFDGGFDAEVVRAHYDGEVRHTDAQLGRLFDALEAAGRFEDTWIVVTSDHGESLGEHAYWFEHGLYAYEATTRVPLLVRPPGGAGAAAGARAGDLSLADLAPTLLELFGLPALAPGGAPGAGVSRPALFLEDAPSEGPVFVFKTERADLDGSVQLRAARRGPWKLIQGHAYSTGADGEARLGLVREELYRVDEDPHEARDLSTDPPQQAPLEQLRADLAHLIASEGDLRAHALEQLALRRKLEAEAGEDLRLLERLGYE
jgi:arylsulfatase A-like enzyme